MMLSNIYVCWTYIQLTLFDWGKYIQGSMSKNDDKNQV